MLNCKKKNIYITRGKTTLIPTKHKFDLGGVKRDYMMLIFLFIFFFTATFLATVGMLME